MDLQALKASLAGAAPPEELPALVRALWLDARGEWHAAHELANEVGGRDGAWVHAYLHREEGDLPNAAYWYERAGRPPAQGPLEREWEAIASALLAR